MSKLKNIVKQLSEKDYLEIVASLQDSNAEKSASLLKYLKERQLSDAKIMVELDVNPNAYYTLRSRLNEKIEDYLVKQMESPKTDLLRKVANISEIIFTKKKTIVVATLKKLEKELLDYDLSSELIIVYKNLKKQHINTPEHYHYSQLYNKHVAYMLAIDKAESILADYFKKFGSLFLSGDELIKTELTLLCKEIKNISHLYQSHRLYVYQSCMTLFHRFFVEYPSKNTEEEKTEVIFEKIDEIFDTYPSDATYHHLQIVSDYLKLCYYTETKNTKKAEKYFEEVKDSAGIFIANYSLYTFPQMFFLYSLNKCTNPDIAKAIIEENKAIFADFECESSDISKFVTYNCYRALLYFYAQKYDMSSKIINTMLNDVSLKKYPELYVETKTFQALTYCLIDDYDLFNQLMNSIQRQVRMLGKKRLEHITYLSKAMKTSLSTTPSRGKTAKLKMLVNKINMSHIKYFSPLKLVKFDEFLMEKLSS
ncbi:MAG: hypothetical protein SFY32_03695 [Bacteroidota bacterium]|nr:hypothetical protein [Bacteroidota bacterium]